MKEKYKVEIYSAYFTETKNGYEEPILLDIQEFNKYADALEYYKYKKEKGNCAIFINRDGDIRHFKTI